MIWFPRLTITLVLLPFVVGENGCCFNDRCWEENYNSISTLRDELDSLSDTVAEQQKIIKSLQEETPRPPNSEGGALRNQVVIVIIR